ncbi:arylamine N-acetyltransferase (macronuclear) [Tetrahymena thermophila SB210]|uniref:Arylamine N-acetyltransferase n=2 Tax=Tetrahymena thermophila TaxID=5911 RepID=I7MAE7_TETTS|nr:arylamine N-acetyltransferase [Tetrahymena thermophila SB210]EAS04439.1 arylamine N-acetyltransferase [Tetrahymena thermophila SB210]CBL43374.1 TPA: arylamine N-acetyltransferase 1 [Tetrahymena thermophila]|eukprot:XP_001024684.1 arylamine N-acetyltransferase [Tetrahymena thermophila SB210]
MKKNTQLKLSDLEADQFLKNLKLERYVEGQCRLQYLELAMQKAQDLIPFQNVFLLATPFQDRRQLTYEEIKQLVLSGSGGFCLILNPVFCGLLQNLGYDAQIIQSSCLKIPENHVAILVKNLLQEGDRYLVDVGLGFKNVPLKVDFDKKTEMFQNSFGQYYYEWEDDTKQVLNRIDPVNNFFNSYTFNVYQDYEDLLDHQGDVYTGTAKSPFHSVLWMIRFPSSGSICLKNNDLLVENVEKKQLEPKEVIQNIDQFAECLTKYFPMVDKELALKAYQTYSEKSQA